MIKIEYNLTSYEDFFRHLAKCLKLRITDNIIYFTPDKGSGFIKFINLLNGLQLLIYDYTTYEDIVYHHKKSDKDFFVLRLDEITSNGTLASKASVFFGNTTQEWFYMAQANNHLKHVNIIFSRKWIHEYLGDEKTADMLLSYIALKSPFILYELMDAEYKRLMHELMDIPTDRQFEEMIVQNRTSLILERFFTRLYRGIENADGRMNVSPRELRSIKLVEQELLRDFSQQPPAIVQLSRLAAMSPSKLKTLFKEVFGSPVNQYYQKHRMNKAKAMLISKKYSVKEVADMLGFSSVSSFNRAFYKVFEQFPVEISGQSKK